MKNLMIFLTAVILAFVGIYPVSGAFDDSIEKHVFSNGLRLILNKQSSKKLISFCALIDGSARIEAPNESGISHFIEHLVFRGPTDNQKELELRKMFRLWGDFSGYTSDDYTCYGFTVRTEDFDEALVEFVDGLMNLTIPDSVIEKERSVVTREIHQRADIPYIKLYHLFDATALKIHPYRNPVIGYEELIQNIDSDVIRKYYRDHYTPDNIVLAVTGDFDPDLMVSKIENSFSRFKPYNLSFERGMHDPPQEKEMSAIEKADVSSMHLLMGWRIPEARENTSPVLKVLAEILGGDDDSRLNKTLKTDLGLVDEISCFADLKHDQGFMHIYTTAPEENLNEIRGIVLKEIESISLSPPNNEEINRAKKRIENDHSFNHQTFWEISQHLAMWEVLDNLDQGVNWIDLVNAVDQQDLIDSALKYLHPSGVTWVALVPEEKQESGTAFADVPFEKVKPVIEPEDGDVLSTTLLNNARFIFKRDTSSNIIAISALAGYGQMMEDAGKEGVGEFTARMLLKGCGVLDSSGFRRKTAELGCKITASGARDYVNVSMEIRKDRLRDGLSILGMVLFEPAFDAREIEIVRGELVAEIERRRESSFNLVNDTFFRKIYGSTPYSNPVQGRIDSISNISADDLIDYHSRAFAPRNLVIGISGDTDYLDLLTLLNGNIGRLTRTSRVSEKLHTEYPIENIPDPVQDEEILYMPRSQVSYNMGLIGLTADDPDYPALKMLTRMLSMRLFDKYVYELGWSYRMWFYMPTRRGPSPLMFEMGVDENHFEDARQGLIAEMRNIVESPITDEEFEKTRKYILQSFQLGMQKNIDTAFNLAFYEKVGLGYDYVVRHDEIYNAIEQSDLIRAGRKYFDSEKLSLVAIVPSVE